MPERKFFGNHVSAIENKSFVFEAIEELLSFGSVIAVTHEQVHVCSTLSVVPKKNNKLRLILDLRYVHGFLSKFKFSYEDLRVVTDILEECDWFFSFDLRNGYHRVDIFEGHRKFLAFSFVYGSENHYFVFASLLFGLSTAPYVFTKLLRPVVAYWRSNGIKISVYLDDGIGADRSRSLCSDRTVQVHKLHRSFGYCFGNLLCK